jgi:hypothetical protein
VQKEKRKMKSQKIVVLAVAVIAIGIFALPSTVSLFSGQHSWYDLSAQGNNVPCEKCHADIADEMSHTGPHVDMECWHCHKTGDLTGFTYASGDGTGSTSGQEAHAASAVECMACHEGFGADSCLSCHFGATSVHPAEWNDTSACENCHKDPGGQSSHSSTKLEAGGFNLTVNSSSDTGELAAHKVFVLDAIDEPLMEGANEACIACHTRVGVNITWTKNENLEFTATEDANGEWTIPSFAAGGENVTQVNTSNTWTT